jgi:hypothetical protein
MNFTQASIFGIVYLARAEILSHALAIGRRAAAPASLTKLSTNMMLAIQDSEVATNLVRIRPKP